VHADVQLGGDLGVGAALGDQGDKLPFPGAEQEGVLGGGAAPTSGEFAYTSRICRFRWGRSPARGDPIYISLPAPTPPIAREAGTYWATN
jgi:hypothetical protein